MKIVSKMELFHTAIKSLKNNAETNQFSSSLRSGRFFSL